jgi:outer membrane receptor protein involved in Fe transport
MWFQAVLLLSFWLFPPDDLSLTGVVFDSNAKPVSDVRVMLEHTTDRQQTETFTNRDGAFRFDRLALGTYHLTIQKEGYFDNMLDVQLEASKTIEFTLAPIETVKQELQVVARPDAINTEAVSEQQTISEEMIQSVPYTGKRSVLSAVSLMPGIVRDNNGQVHINGSRADQVRYELDGMNLTNPTYGGLSSNIPIDSIESVDVDLSGYSAEYGKASGGVVRVHSQFVGNQYRFSLTDFVPGINFERKKIADLSPRLQVSGPIVPGRLWFMYSGSLRYVRTFMDDLPDGSNEQNETVTDQLIKLQYNIKESHVLTLHVLHNSDFLGNMGLSIFRPPETTTNSLRRGTTFGISNRQMVRGKLLETILQSSRRRETELAKGDKFLEARPEGWRGNFFSDRWAQNNRFHVAQTIAWEKPAGRVLHRFKAGGEFDEVLADLQFERRPFFIFGGAGDLKSEVSFQGPTSTKVRNREYGAFVLDRIVFSTKFQTEFGARFDRESLVGRNNLSPRAAFSFLPLGNNRSKISGGVGLFFDNIALLNFQLPHTQRRLETMYEDGVPQPLSTPAEVRVSSNVKNPMGLHWNVAWDHEWRPRWVSRIDYVQKIGRRQVRLAARPNPNGFDMVFDNSGQSHFKSVAFTLDRPIRTNLRILASYTYSISTARPSLAIDFPDPSVEGVPEAPAEWNNRHRFVTWGYFPLPAAFNASFSIEARSGFPFTPINEFYRIVDGYNNREMPGYFVTNFTVEKEIPIPFKRRIAFRVGATNLFNRFNPRVVDPNINSPFAFQASDSSGRHFVGRLRILKK